MRPSPGEVLHFSEDPAITEFHPHVTPTSALPDAYVWAVGHDRAPDYWFPRQCPRAMAWTTARTTESDARSIIGPGGGSRVHAIEYGWLDRMRTVELYAYRFPAGLFQPFPADEPHAQVATTAVRPLGPPERVGDLFALHAEAGIQLRVLPNLHEFWDAVIASTLAFSGIRLRNAIPRPAVPAADAAAVSAAPDLGGGHEGG